MFTKQIVLNQWYKRSLLYHFQVNLKRSLSRVIESIIYIQDINSLSEYVQNNITLRALLHIVPVLFQRDLGMIACFLRDIIVSISTEQF